MHAIVQDEQRLLMPQGLTQRGDERPTRLLANPQRSCHGLRHQIAIG